jgi:hypothetical protein
MLIREAAEGAMSRESVKPLAWPALRETSGWFGAFLGLECGDEGAYGIRMSLIDSIDGSLELFDALFDGSDYWGLSRPQPGNRISYDAYVRDVVELKVSDFLKTRFQTP